MYERVKSTLLWLLKVPPEPHDPMGDVHSLRVFRAAPGYLRYITIAWALWELAILLSGLLLFIPLAIATATGLAAILVTALGLLAAVLFLAQAGVSFFSLRLNYEMRWYKVTDRSLRIRAGVWNVHEMTMTFANVQNITISQGPIERLFGISDVRVDTAGGGGSSGPHGKAEGLNLHVATFRGVDNPEEIRDLMLQRLRHLRDAGLGDLDDASGLRGAPVHDPALGSTETLQVLSAFRDEARALRRAAEAVFPR
jgi:membrane protein YdbS with pleckstrin-like domain